MNEPLSDWQPSNMESSMITFTCFLAAWSMMQPPRVLDWQFRITDLEIERANENSELST